MTEANRAPPTPLPLTRLFAVVSALVVLAAAAALSYHHRAAATDQLIRMAERNSVDLTITLRNSIWPRFSGFVDNAHRMTPDEIRRHPMTAELNSAVAELMAGTPILKVKLYDTRGLTVFSTEPAQIGKDYSTNPRFLKAFRSDYATKLELRESFNSIVGPVEDRYVLSSYIPIRPAGQIEGVAEIYSDVTAFHAHMVH